jgi:hypothetical protein
MPVQVSGSSALTTGAQLPVEFAQLEHEPLQALEQQVPSTQKPLAHADAALHDCPFLSLQAPLGSQVLVPVQVSGSSPFLTAVHVPVPQLKHTPVQSLLQQLPSAQKPLVH